MNDSKSIATSLPVDEVHQQAFDAAAKVPDSQVAEAMTVIETAVSGGAVLSAAYHKDAFDSAATAPAHALASAQPPCHALASAQPSTVGEVHQQAFDAAAKVPDSQAAEAMTVIETPVSGGAGLFDLQKDLKDKLK